MTNLEWVKQEWIRTIQELSEEELYELLTNGTVQGGICKYCEKVFPPCKDTLNSDRVCKERFKILCDMEHQEEKRNADI